MADKLPMQADGGSTSRENEDGNGEVASRRGGLAQTGESGGGAYPNPHTGKKPTDGPESFMGHGGQSEIEYHGAGEDGTQGGGKENSATQED